ncbi:UbiA prenyltransferase family protein [Streptomyces pratens]|uniref:UbiA prenyltransferase family protein n=1 Tax=Streptomyces pratens TaxID=887456 RepID=A0ABW1M0V0_9ACTN
MTTSADQPLDTSLDASLPIPMDPHVQVRDQPLDDQRLATSLPADPPRRRIRSVSRGLLSLVRPGQWPKNLLVVPLALFDAQGAPRELLAGTAWAVVLFTLASSLVYVLNDLYDRHRDRMHPTKRHRPIASGQVSVPTAIAYGALLALVLTGAALYGPVTDWWPIAVYLCLNTAYSHGLKHVPLLDVFVVAAGFALRAIQGYLAGGTAIHSWMLVSVFSLCLVFILGKRRHEMTAGGVSHRPALRGYSVQFLDHLIALCAGVTVITFLLNLQESVGAPHTDLAILGSTPFALFAMARYLQLLHVQGGGGEPTRILLRDRAMVVASLLWALLLGGTVLATHY